MLLIKHHPEPLDFAIRYADHPKTSCARGKTQCVRKVFMPYAMSTHHQTLDDNEEELPMSLYLPNLYDIAGQDKNARRGALKVGGNSFLPKPLHVLRTLK
jgi:hypothetical protein